MKDNLCVIRERGFVLIRGIFSAAEIAVINRSIESYAQASHEGVVYEKNSPAVRAIHGPHLFNSFFLDLAKNRYLIEFSQKYLSDSIYIHQYKINMKRAMEGECWPWHQDYVYWKEGDHIETPQLINVSIALDDISMLSGPLCVIPGSHKFGDLTKYDGIARSDWKKDVSSDLTYKINRESLLPLVERNGYEFLTCKAGDVIFFDPQLAHASSNNLSPFDRRLLIVTYNAVSNAPVKKSKRPPFLCAVDFTPLTANSHEPIYDESILEDVV
jgi:ectoine hydroxylase